MTLRSAPQSRSRRRSGGFTLLEIMMSAAVLLVAVIGFYGVFGASNQLAYAARVNTSARIQLESALAQALTQPWRSEQPTPGLLQPTAGWERFLLPGETEFGTPPTNVTLLIDARRSGSTPTPIMRGVLERNVVVDSAVSNGRRVSFRLTYGGPLAPAGLRTAAPVVMNAHTFRTRDN